MALADKVQELDQQIAAAVKTALSNLRRELDEHLRESTDSIKERIQGFESGLPRTFLAQADLAGLAAEEGAKARSQGSAELAQALAAIDRASSQGAILSALLDQSTTFATRAALFLTPEGAARGWQGRGFGDSGAELAAATFSYDTGAWAELAQGRGTVQLGAADCAELASRLECSLPREAVLIPLVLADRVAAALYADRPGEGALDVSALQSMVYTAALAIEVLPLRSRASTPTFRLGSAGASEGLPLWSMPIGSGVTTAAPALEPTAPAAEEAATKTPEAEPEVWAAPIAEPAQPEMSIEMPASSTLGLDEVSVEIEEELILPDTVALPLERAAEIEPLVDDWEETAVDLFAPNVITAPGATLSEPAAFALESAELADTSAIPTFTDSAFSAPSFSAGDATPLAWPEPTAPELVEIPELPAIEEPDEVELPPISEPPPPEQQPNVPERPPEPPPTLGPSTPTLVMPAVSLGGDETLLMPRMAPPVPARPSAIEDEPEEATHPGRGPLGVGRQAPRPSQGAEVRPPSGFEGPGLAFSPGGRSPMAAGEPTGHEEARRLARLLVSEIRLYNEEQVEEGRRNRDIYARLRDEIDRSRKMYDERISSEVRSARDYFGEELVRRLADGDPDVLGM